MVEHISLVPIIADLKPKLEKYLLYNSIRMYWEINNKHIYCRLILSSSEVTFGCSLIKFKELMDAMDNYFLHCKFTDIIYSNKRVTFHVYDYKNKLLNKALIAAYELSEFESEIFQFKLKLAYMKFINKCKNRGKI